MELGERIRQRRQELGWTQADVCNGAEEAKITRNMLSLIEKGKATPAGYAAVAVEASFGAAGLFFL